MKNHYISMANFNSYLTVLHIYIYIYLSHSCTFHIKYMFDEKMTAGKDSEKWMFYICFIKSQDFFKYIMSFLKQQQPSLFSFKTISIGLLGLIFFFFFFLAPYNKTGDCLARKPICWKQSGDLGGKQAEGEPVSCPGSQRRQTASWDTLKQDHK